MTKVVIYGAGGNGKEIAETISAAARAGSDLELLGFLDDAPELHGVELLDLPVLGSADWLRANPDVLPVIGVGHPRIRRRVDERIQALGRRWATVVHPAAMVFPSARIGEGSVLFAGAVVSSNSSIGRLVQLSFHAVVHHDSTVADWACVMASSVVAGGVRVGEGAFLGIGVSTRQDVSIGGWTLIGAGASVVRDLPDRCIATGVPARVSRQFASWEQMPGF